MAKDGQRDPNRQRINTQLMQNNIDNITTRQTITGRPSGSKSTLMCVVTRLLLLLLLLLLSLLLFFCPWYYVSQERRN